MNNSNRFVLALGGSVAFPQKIDVSFLAKFRSFILQHIKEGKRFVIVVGGGQITRVYQQAASQITDLRDEDKDWLGIHATRLNAHFLRTIFQGQAHPVVFDRRFKHKGFGRYRLIIASGWRPGWSTDFVAVQIALDFGLKMVCILGKPDYVYTKDPDKDKDAQPISKVTWQEYLKLIPNKWTPGLSAPVDPVAASLAQKHDLKVVVAKGTDLCNLKDVLDGKRFKGTLIY